jgi:hypothetical protein
VSPAPFEAFAGGCPVAGEEVPHLKAEHPHDLGNVASGKALQKDLAVIAFSDAEAASGVVVRGAKSSVSFAAFAYAFEFVKNSQHRASELLATAHRISFSAGFAERAGRRPRFIRRSVSVSGIFTNLPNFTVAIRRSEIHRRIQAAVTPSDSANSLTFINRCFCML